MMKSLIASTNIIDPIHDSLSGLRDICRDDGYGPIIVQKFFFLEFKI